MKLWIKKNWFYIALVISIGAFLLFKEFLNNYSQALLVLITTIYVIATINISNANVKSAEATREQIIESKRQFDETLRLQVIPIFQISIDTDAEIPYSEICKDELFFTLFSQEKEMLCKVSYFTLSIENVGVGTAKDIRYIWHYIDSEKKENCFPQKALFQKDRAIYIINTGIEDSNAKTGSTLNTDLDIEYRDLLERKYTQKVHLSFCISDNQYAMLQNYTIDKAEYVGENNV